MLGPAASCSTAGLGGGGPGGCRRCGFRAAEQTGKLPQTTGRRMRSPGLRSGPFPTAGRTPPAAASAFVRVTPQPLLLPRSGSGHDPGPPWARTARAQRPRPARVRCVRHARPATKTASLSGRLPATSPRHKPAALVVCCTLSPGRRPSAVQEWAWRVRMHQAQLAVSR